MKSKEFYINEYRAQRDELTKSGELWRLCWKEEKDFIIKLDETIEYYHNGSFLNDFHREHSTESCIDGLLQKNRSLEEITTQMDRHRKATEADFKKDIPAILEQAKSLTTPIHINKLRRIYRWLFRNQITLDDLPTEVKKDFMKTKKLYPHWLKVEENPKRNAQSRDK